MYTPFACGIFKQSPLSEKSARYIAIVTIALAAWSAAMCTSEEEEAAPVKLDDVAPIETLSEDEAGCIIFPSFNTISERDRLIEAIKHDLNPHPGGLELNETVFIQVTIDALGSIIHTRALFGRNAAARQEAIRAIESTHFMFRPLTERGRTVESMVVVPVVFGHGSEAGGIYDRI